MNTDAIIQQIDNEISRLEQAKSILTKGSNGYKPAAASRKSAGPAAAAPKVKRVLSVEARRKIAAAQRRRWAKARSAQAKGAQAK